MSVTVFLSNTNIQIVDGSGTNGGAKVKRLVSVSVPSGAVLNGVVMDETALVLAIKESYTGSVEYIDISIDKLCISSL